MRLIPFSPFKHLEYVRSVLDVPISDSTGGIISVDADGIPKGVVLLDNWADNSVMGHIAIQHPMALRNLAVEAIKYVFYTCNKGLFLTNTPSSVEKSLKLQRKLGFKELYRIKDGFAVGDDYVLMQLKREDCPHIQIREVA